MNPETQGQDGPQTKNEQEKTAPTQLQKKDTLTVIKRVTAWVMIISATLFALVGVLAVWEVFGDNAGDVVWRAFASLGIIAFAALVVNVASRVAEGKH